MKVGVPLLLVISISFMGLSWFYFLNKGGNERRRTLDQAVSVTHGGNPAAGYQIILSTGCGSCHVIPGIPTARGTVGPSLADLKRRAFIGGVFSNSADNLVEWIMHPRKADPRTAMPDLGLTVQQSRDISAYLYADE